MSAYDRIIGHENIIAQLKNAITNNKVNHAYIFDGDDGSGKRWLPRPLPRLFFVKREVPKAAESVISVSRQNPGTTPTSYGCGMRNRAASVLMM